MINDLLSTTGALPDKDTAMVEVTFFCKDVLLEIVWKHLRYADYGEFWELLAVSFEHFLICLERLAIDQFPKDQSPGHAVLQDILGNSPRICRFLIGICRQRNHL